MFVGMYVAKYLFKSLDVFVCACLCIHSCVYIYMHLYECLLVRAQEVRENSYDLLFLLIVQLRDCSLSDLSNCLYLLCCHTSWELNYFSLMYKSIVFKHLWRTKCASYTCVYLREYLFRLCND